ncbi:hypothetical protein BDR07DRAFT_1447977 [Suillus spraguei]|nr:hypothetical protein BDR07DRAFT_1447977 [Suillus spraguei]
MSYAYVTPFHLPHSTYNGNTFTCPNCAEAFQSSDNVIWHLSTAVNCSQWVVQGATNVDKNDNYRADYGDDTEAAQNIYLRYEDFDPLDDTEVISDLPLQPEGPCLPVDDSALASVDPSAGPRPGTVQQYHPNMPVTLPGGKNHLQKMDNDIHANIRNTKNIYYPFTSKSEFDLASWLSSRALSQKEVDSFLCLEHISALPEVPRWYHQQINVGSYKTKSPLMLYWRDGLEVVKYLFSNPAFRPCMDFLPYREYEVINGQFMSADVTWGLQVSDTPLTIGTGNKEMHPVLISLANIHAGVHPQGDIRMIHTPLVAWIADYPEQLLIRCITSKHSPISLATSAKFGNPSPSPP